MTDKLIIMEPTPYATEGFIKLEDGTRLTVAFNAPDGEYLFISSKLCKSFGSRTHLHLTVPPSSRIEDCAIYRKDGDTAYAVLFHGDISKLDRALTQLCGLKAEYPNTAPNDTSNAHETADNNTALSNLDNTLNIENENLGNAPSNGEDKKPCNTASDQGGVNKVQDLQTYTAFTDNTAHSADDTLADDVIEDITSIKELSAKCPETFWECNKEKFSAIFESNEPNELLRELIPGSEWVNVTEENYLLGLINDEDGEPLYICYGFSLPWSDTPPEQLEGYCQWIPCDVSHPHEDGYWVIYINARTGERIK